LAVQKRSCGSVQILWLHRSQRLRDLPQEARQLRCANMSLAGRREARERLGVLRAGLVREQPAVKGEA